ncbi:MAG: Rrf2 family transcriptional regulator, partial [Rhodospirillaceae bacterium]|nr:Rrf2 family transcriptional regulator [Rhodospirillaceae bacterium]
MLRLNRITDYAVVVLTRMAHDPRRLVTAPQLSEESNVPAPTVAKVLKALTKEGILASQRGVNGGYLL